ncbi:hypothetical protein ACFQPF_05350 [Fictibacillus iocasae]|uniref:Small CPxCG-related zinc finger protein n=1 Tax=Fictibacillus iocasae TaxID=2715437 RepID=A0ABW2NK97_9BACL
MKECPECGASLVEDGAEMITFEPDESVVIDAFMVQACSNHCGYAVRVQAEEE